MSSSYKVLLLQKESWIFITDNTNVKWVKTFHLYKGFKRKTTKESFFVKSSARIVEPPRIEYKGFKYKYKIKGDICKVWICRSNKSKFLKDIRGTKFKGNAGLNVNKKMNVMSKYINGPVSRSLRQKKLLTLFYTII